MQVITFSLQTQQPLLATSFQGDPNSDVSYSYIPGSMIRGAIIGRYMKQNTLSELDLNSDEVKRLFFSSYHTCYLNAYLQSQEGKRTLPVSSSLFKHKDDELPEVDSPKLMNIYERTQELELPEGIEPKKIEHQFCTINKNLIVLHSISRRINIHNQRDRIKGRSTQIKLDSTTKQLKGEGEIFRYEAIDAGQSFQAAILCNSEVEVELLTNLLRISPNIWLGGSQSAGYGHTKIAHINCQENWNEVNIAAAKRINRENLTITLLSDLILRDNCGQYSVIPPSAQNEIPVPLTQELEKILGVNLQAQMSFTKSTLIGGFNRKWGLPLPQVPAFAAGSVFVFDDISITSDQIQKLESQGIGERRIEGFGRVVVNWLDELESGKRFAARLPKSDSMEEPILINAASRTLAEKMAEKLLYQKIEQTLQNEVARLIIEGNISNSQLSRLQLLARKALDTGDCNLVLSMLNSLPDHAQRQFERTKIKSHQNSLKQTLDNWLKNPGASITDSQNLTVQVAGVNRSITDEFSIKNKLAEKYILRLIIAIVKKQSRRINNEF